ncbi:putative C6 transcription factor [Dendryphion nanum]|uniref:C6 transcription factor n=1 Tax=Dendryphion nanum TaxID=256645 RepID=A0A9P9CYX4_9PLEO|nr:putative C6 transcription factor [Dendryphion nanum]
MANPSDSSQRLRPLLPLPPLPVHRPRDIPQKRGRISVACEACRQKKLRCSGDRPKCSFCIRRELECRYEAITEETRLQALKRKYDDLASRRSPYEELFGLMKSLSERDAQDILRRLRSGTDVETLVNHIATGNLLLQLHMVPETRYRYEFPYISKMPLNLITDDNPYLRSFIYEPSTIFPTPNQSQMPRQSPVHLNKSLESDRIPRPRDGEHGTYETVYLKPFHAAEVIDPRLSHVKVSSWTSVCDDDVLMRNILGSWLLCEYQFTAAFQKDLFLEDLAANRKDFCSSLLVNAMLGYACICYSQFTNRAEYWNPHTLTYRFIAEAKRLWECESDEPRITTIQTGMIFNVFHNLCGLDEIGQAYRIKAIALAHKMNIFNSSIEYQSPRIRHGTAFTAWALFNWETLVGFSFTFAPLLSEPPDWPLPDPLEDVEWYGENYVKYPLSNHVLPSYFGHVFKAKSEFRILMNEACQKAYSEGSEMTLEKASELLSRLKLWFDDLPGPLKPESIVLPAHLQLHMYYHHLILTIFKPLLDTKVDSELSPQQIVDHSTICLQTLFRLYFLRHGYEAMDLFIVIPLTLAASDCIDAINDQTPTSELEALRSTLILVVTGLHSQRRNHYLAQALFRVTRGRMRPAEVSLFRSIKNIDMDAEDERPNMTQVVRSNWPISVVKKQKDRDAYVLKNLVDSYAHLNIEGDGLNGGGETGKTSE